MRSQLMAIATASPPFELRTEDVIAEATRIFAGRHQDFERLMPVFANTGIEAALGQALSAGSATTRAGPSGPRPISRAPPICSARPPRAALAQAGIEAGEIDAIVTVSSTGVATPSIEARVMHELGFHDDVSRVPVFGLGCAGGVTGLSLAARLAQSAGNNVLLVVIELCTLAFRPDEMTKSNIIATALFGDGAAACVLSGKQQERASALSNSPASTAGPTRSTSWAGAWTRRASAPSSRSASPISSTQELRAAADGFLARNGTRVEDIDQFVFHPGGAKVIAALEQAFHLDQGRSRSSARCSPITATCRRRPCSSSSRKR